MPCAADDDGGNCYREIVMATPVPLCAFHRAQIALVIVPDLLRNHIAATEASVVAPPLRSDLVSAARSTPIDQLLDGVHDSVVYFIVNGGRVKIGFTTNLKSRLGALTLRPDSVLLTVVGGPDLERALHAHFGAYRDGSTEWFELSPEIFQYIADRRTPSQSRPAASFSKPRNAGSIRDASAADSFDLLADVLAVVPIDEERVWNERVATRLARLRPSIYGEWKGETVTVSLKRHGITTKDVAGFSDEGKRTTRRGVDRIAVAVAQASKSPKAHRSGTR